MTKPKRLTDEQRKMVEENHRLIETYLKKHRQLDKEEWYDVLCIALCNAANKYNEALGAFSTYAFKCFSAEIITEIKHSNCYKERLNKELIYFEEEGKIGDNYDPDNYKDYLEFRVPRLYSVENEAMSDYILDEYYKNHDVTGNDKKIFSLYSMGYSQNEIAEMLGCTRQNISRIKQKFEKYLRELS